MKENHVIWIWLKTALNDRSLKTYKTYQEFKSIDAVFSADKNVLERLNFLDEKDRDALLNKDLCEAQKTIRLCESNNIGIVTIDDNNYPALLKEIDNPPCVLFYYGNYEKAFSKPCITIVGTRDCTTYGEVTTSYISGMLAACGFTIACGVAKGIDTAALESAVKADGSVIMVLPDGLISTNYQNKYKFKNIRYNGVVISEHLPNERTSKYAYHERNRILSGISLGTIVTQAPEKSGALITANYAADQGRDVYALVANIDMVQSKGSNRLIKDGATPIFGYEDILEVYYTKFKDVLVRHVEKDLSQTLKRSEDDRFIKAEDFKRVIMKQLGEDEQQVFKLMSHREITADYIIDRTNLPVPQVLGIISVLEAKGAIVSCPGNKYKILV